LVSAASRSLFFHTALDLAELTEALPASFNLGEKELQAILEKLSVYSLGLSRRNTDTKNLAGYLEWNLIELRWDFSDGADRTSVRLIGSEMSEISTVFLGWHVKNPLDDLEAQRFAQNQACEKAKERMKSVDPSYYLR
jgi:hypothetical protein